MAKMLVHRLMTDHRGGYDQVDGYSRSHMLLLLTKALMMASPMGSSGNSANTIRSLSAARSKAKGFAWKIASRKSCDHLSS
jgi:hypothetical protein